MKRYEYIVDDNGIIYRKSNKGIKEVPKRLGTRGELEFKHNGKTISYKRFVAIALIPNPNECNEVHYVNSDKFDTRPQNLKWVWTRAGRTFTQEQALQIATDPKLIEYYKTGDKRILRRHINNHFEANKYSPELLSELYILINNYAERNLLFNLESDISGTYIGLIRQSKRKRIKTTDYKEGLLSHQCSF